MAYIQEVADANPDVASILDVATSSENRPVRGLKISTGSGKKAIWMDCAIHSREWAAPPVCLKTIEQVMASPELQNLVDWYILPLANPDGYSYTWSNVS
jgi:murein tripeptide amidase MpaA